ncbi:MAG: sugar phosphate isomerase/epimerase [Acetobacteraceae bacterium]|nr:sugar phosphate isomerase/epimerase [Acetobacteraceae bacterium]
MQDGVAVQLYSLRSLGGLDRQLEAAADAGYHYVELVGGQVEDRAATLVALKNAGLSACSAHVGLDTLRERPEQIMSACRELGFSELYVPSVPREERDNPAPYWTAIGQELGQMAERFASEGIHLGYHNHDWELRASDGGRNELDLLFAAAGGSPLAWEVDVAWLERGGADPLELIRRYAGRINAAHVKDLAPAGKNLEEDGWADVGAGTVDWRALWPACREAGARWMVIEHDKPADPGASIARSLRFIRTLEALA